MDGPPAKILVVANPADADELVGLLGEGGDVAVSDGGDDTVTRFVAERPEVVVIAATVDAGDARALIAALRGAAPAGSFHVVLIGDARGPIRNALDAADFGADRFVARPVAAKALRFAVDSGAGAARRARTAGAPDTSAAPVAVVPERMSTRVTGTHRAVMIAQTEPPPAAPPRARPGTLAERIDAMLDAAVEDESVAEVERRTSGGFSIPVDAILAAGGSLDDAQDITRSLSALPSASPPVPAPAHDNTAPMTVHEVPTRPVSTLTIQPRRAAASNGGATAATPSPVPPPMPPFRRPSTPPPPPRTYPRATRGADAVDEIAIDETDILDAGEPMAPLGLGEESGSHVLPPGLEAPRVTQTAGSFEDPTVDGWPVGDSHHGEWDAPQMPAREPTLILSEAAATAPPPMPVSGQVDVTERHSDGAWASVSAVSPMHDEGTDGEGRRDRGGDDVVPRFDLPDFAGAMPTDDLPPSGGEFARELRKKMSAMAQRLFRGSDATPPPVVDPRPTHDFRTEIDLASIDPVESPAAAAVYDLQGDATFAGDDHGLPTSVGHLDAGSGTSGSVSARTSESGEITRGTSDVAVLIARMFTTEMTGRITFRRGTTEKVIYFDGGRPVFASSNLPEDRMGELLYREGKITAEQHAGSRDLVVESGRRMGEILVDRGYLKRRELLPAVRRHVEDVIYSLFAWDGGEYRISPGDGASGERIRLSRHPAAMVLEGVRRKLALATLERLLGPSSTVVEVADRDKAGTVIAVADLSGDERGALAAMDGSADLGHIARATGAALVTVYQLAWSMTLLGVATVRRRGGDDDDAPALVGETDLAIDRERVRARHRLVAEADYFALLGVRRDATGFEIRRAYEASRRDFDAESFPPELRGELGLELAEVAAVLDEAYRVLRDDRLRVEYLAHLEP